MEWFLNLLKDPASIAHIVVVYAAVISIGVKLGKIKFGGVALGVTFVLFAGIVAGHIFNQFGIDHAAQKPIIDVVKEIGLILFVYCIGLQVGPSFFATFRQGGLGMNMLTVGLVLLNVGVMLGLYYMCVGLGLLDNSDGTALPMMVGVMYGAVTNTPGLGAANGVLPSLFTDGNVPAIANGYACAYPLGVVGIILATIAIRYLCRISLEKEQEKIRLEQESNPHATPKHLVIKVTNQVVVGRTLKELHSFLKREFVVSRIIVGDSFIIPNGETKLELGMELHLVCAENEAEPITVLMGEALPKDWKSDMDLKKYVSRRLVITKPEINGKTFGQLHFSSVYGVNVTRIIRNGIELFANRNLRLQVGDRILVTGTEENIEHVKNVIGASTKKLDHPNVGAIFFGIMVGIIVGQIPIPIPGVEIPVKLGLAGGPLVVAILIGAFGYRYKINTYTSTS
ncbi:MAG: transporter, partial [Bacteroidaceae bacterium]|nr:transporter [Bacteroidaceae bacterium]